MISLIILIALIAVFIVQMSSEAFTNLLIFDPLTAMSEPWRFITSIFLHGGILHLFFNGYALFIFGSILERRIGLKDYLIIFFGAGLAGSVFYYATYLLGIIPPIPALGASGAIYGVLGAVAILVPNLTVFFWFIPMPVRYAAICWFILEFLGSFDTSSGIASAAHLGGLLFGVAFAMLIKSVSYEPPHWETGS